MNCWYKLPKSQWESYLNSIQTISFVQLFSHWGRMLIVLWLTMENPDEDNRQIKQSESSWTYLLHNNLITVNIRYDHQARYFWTVNLIAHNTLSLCEKYSHLGITNQKATISADTGTYKPCRTGYLVQNIHELHNLLYTIKTGEDKTTIL